MATAKKLPSGMWRCQVSTDGVRRSFTAHTKKEAEYLALEWQTRKKQERNPENLTVRQLVERYIDGRDGILSPTTIIGYRTKLNNNFADIENIKVRKLDEYVIQKWINNISKGLSPKSVRDAYGLFKSATKLSYDVALPQKKKLEYNTPDVASCQAILRATKGTKIELPVILAMWCSLRMSEVRGLKWDRVMPDSLIIDTALIHMGGQDIEKGTKTTGSERVIKIPSYIYDIIMRQPMTEKYVVPYSANHITRTFHDILAKNNIPNCRFHDLRHANASIMLMLGFPDKYAMERGGWSTNDVLKNVYQQTYDSEADIMTDKLNEFFVGLLSNENAHKNTHTNTNNLLN